VYVEPSPQFDARLRPSSAHLRARWERIALAPGLREIEAWVS
jgi:hypothetical protein